MTEAAMSCEQVLMRVLDFIDRELAEEDRARLERHLETCRSCYSRVEFERRLKGRLADLPSEQAPSAVRDRVARLIAGF
jgi:mycothiol system anti-sigma-R factor